MSIDFLDDAPVSVERLDDLEKFSNSHDAVVAIEDPGARQNYLKD